MKETLEKIVNEHDLINQTLKNFWECYDDYLADEDTKEEAKQYGLVDRNSINAELYGYSFWVSNDMDFVHIKIYIDCFLKGQSMRFATYWCIYDLQGEFIDDYFVCEQKLRFAFDENANLNLTTEHILHSRL